MRAIRVTDSSRLTDHSACQRNWYWGYGHKGRGIRSTRPSEDLLYGLAFHEGAEWIVQGVPLYQAWEKASLILDPLGDDLTTLDGHTRKSELSALLYAHLRIFAEVFLPAFLERYRIVAIEKELVNPLSDLIIYATRLDLIVQRIADGMAFNVNYKTTSRPNMIYRENEYNLQLLMEADSARANGLDWIGGSILVPVNKGPKQYGKDEESGLYRRNSPLIYAYKKVPPMGEIKYQPKYQYGWERTAVWVELSVEEWMSRLLRHHNDIIVSQITELQPIDHPQERVESIRRQIVGIETKNALGLESLESCSVSDRPRVLDAYFPQNFKQCSNWQGYGYPCPYRDLCHGGACPEEGFEFRIPNHPVEDLYLPPLPLVEAVETLS